MRADADRLVSPSVRMDHEDNTPELLDTGACACSMYCPVFTMKFDAIFTEEPSAVELGRTRSAFVRGPVTCWRSRHVRTESADVADRGDSWDIRIVSKVSGS
jgi:hypothetical protein